ncbi:DUF2087 domain-containing protein [Rothia sp. CCM 9417]|uniref:DUF2087 domain-containing protein n=1 Tax=unclassified Rothia (in: high G+C Gram-positive bacteria) TaxID=2689056 RepID=UPI003ACB7248
MTANRNFKKLVRARMQETGLNFTAARQGLIDELAQQTAEPSLVAQAELTHQTVVQRFFKDGVLTSWPSKRRTRAHILLHLVTYFEPGRIYSEPEVNEILKALWHDFAFMRREMVQYGYLVRSSSGRSYRLATQLAVREGTLLHAEAPDWEAIWLPGYLAER